MFSLTALVCAMGVEIISSNCRVEHAQRWLRSEEACHSEVEFLSTWVEQRGFHIVSHVCNEWQEIEPTPPGEDL